jgi:hypothetical protein
VLRDQHISVGGWGERTINTQTPKLRRPSFFLNYPPLSLLLAFSEITETDPTILIRQPSLLTWWHKIEMGNQHIIIWMSKQLCGFKSWEIKVAKGTVVGRREELIVSPEIDWTWDLHPSHWQDRSSWLL